MHRSWRTLEKSSGGSVSLNTFADSALKEGDVCGGKGRVGEKTGVREKVWFFAACIMCSRVIINLHLHVATN